MKTLLTILNRFFVLLGIIFLALLLTLLYLWLADPFNIKPLLGDNFSPGTALKTITGQNQIKIDNIDKNPLLNEEQEAQVEALGIDPATLPTEITPALEACLVEKLGAKRSQEIVQGSEPTTADFVKARVCFN